MEKKILIAYYSRTGHVERVAKAIAKELGADLDRIIPENDYGGTKGYNKAGFEAMLRRKPKIKFAKDPSKYDLVIVGSPMWAFTMSSPARSYILQNKAKMKAAAFFTSSGSRFRFALNSMKRAYRRKPVSTLQIREKEIEEGSYDEKKKKFINDVRNALG